MSIRIGRLRHRIEIQAATKTPDRAGGSTERWETIEDGNVWARVEPLEGRERFDMLKLESVLTHRVTVRYRTGVNAAMRVKFGARTLSVRAVVNPDERNERLDLLCQEIAA